MHNWHYTTKPSSFPSSRIFHVIVWYEKPIRSGPLTNFWAGRNRPFAGPPLSTVMLPARLEGLYATRRGVWLLSAAGARSAPAVLLPKDSNSSEHYKDLLRPTLVIAISSSSPYHHPASKNNNLTFQNYTGTSHVHDHHTDCPATTGRPELRSPALGRFFHLLLVCRRDAQTQSLTSFSKIRIHHV